MGKPEPLRARSRRLRMSPAPQRPVLGANHLPGRCHLLSGHTLSRSHRQGIATILRRRTVIETSTETNELAGSGLEAEIDLRRTAAASENGVMEWWSDGNGEVLCRKL